VGVPPLGCAALGFVGSDGLGAIPGVVLVVPLPGVSPGIGAVVVLGAGVAVPGVGVAVPGVGVAVPGVPIEPLPFIPPFVVPVEGEVRPAVPGFPIWPEGLLPAWPAPAPAEPADPADPAAPPDCGTSDAVNAATRIVELLRSAPVGPELLPAEPQWSATFVALLT
jgi:hypothetical protein